MEVDESVSHRLRRVYLSVFFSSIGLGSVYLIPAFAEGLGATYFDLGLIGTVRSLPYMFLPVIVGYLGDRFDRRLLYLSSIFLTGAGTLVLALTNTISAIVLVQVFLGVGFALFWPLSEALVSEFAPLRKRTAVMGTYAVAWASGFLIGPLIGGLIADAVGFQVAFLVAGLVVLATAVASVAVIPRSDRKQSQKIQPSAKPEWSFISKVLSVVIVQIPYGIVFAFIVSILPGYATASGLTPSEVGALISGFGLARTVTFSFSGRFERIGERKSSAAAFIAMAAVLLMIPLNRSFSAFLLNMCLIGVCLGIIYPQTAGYVSKHAPLANMGFALGLYETIFGIGFAVGPITFGLVAQLTGPDFAYVVLAIVALSSIPMLVVSERNRLGLSRIS